MEHYYKAGSMRAKPGDTDPKFGPFTLIDWRKRHGLSQAKVAELLGSTKNTIARWERGEMRMQNPQQVKLALEGAEHKGLVKSR